MDKQKPDLLNRQHGTASVEYVIILLICITALFATLPGFEDSLVSTLVTAFRQFQANSTFLLSLP